MKARFGFVSNSSSCSFVLDVSGLRKSQKNKILHHEEFAENIGWDGACRGWGWEIKEDGDKWFCNTSLDNFDLVRWIVEVVGLSPDRMSDMQEGHW